MRNASRPIHSIFILISVLIYTVIKYNYHSVIEYKSKVTWMGWGVASCPFLTMLFNLIRITMLTKISNPLKIKFLGKTKQKSGSTLSYIQHLPLPGPALRPSILNTAGFNRWAFFSPFPLNTTLEGSLEGGTGAG